MVATPVFANLDDARDQLIQELDNLKPGESPEPYVQNFLPAVLPALRLARRLGGRKNVVNFLAQLLAKLISKLIGPEQAPALSKAIVDAGLKTLDSRNVGPGEIRSCCFCSSGNGRRDYQSSRLVAGLYPR